MITLICIYSNEFSHIRKFLKAIKTSNVVNYVEISNKLTKNDIYSQEPSSIIINSHIVKILEKFLLESDSNIIYYVMSNLEPDTIHNLRSYAESIVNKDKLKLTALIHNKDLYEKIHFLFDNVLELDSF